MAALISDSKRRGKAALALLALLGLSAWCISPIEAGPIGLPDCHYPTGTSSVGGAGKVSPQAVEVGNTQLFWALAQGFFQGYYQLSATCQSISPHAYLFTEDAYINDLCASPENGDTIFAAAQGGLYRSLDGGQYWNIFIAGLPAADGTVGDLDSADYNRRCQMHCLFSRAEYGEGFDTVWVGTEFGPFWRSPALGDSFEIRASMMASDPDGFEPATYDILGHPTASQTLWAATEDGVYMTRNAKNWKHAANGLPPSESASWTNDPAYALEYDSARNLLFTSTTKGVFYGTPRALGSSATSAIMVSWKPLGGEVAIMTHPAYPATADTLRLSVADSSSKGLEIAAGQSITVLDLASGLYWTVFVDVDTAGLFGLLTDSSIFYYPSGTTPPAVDYSQLSVDSLVAYAYSQVLGKTLYVETQGTTTTIWLGDSSEVASLSDSAGVVSYRLVGDITDHYTSDQETIARSHSSLSVYKIDKKADEYYIAANQGFYRTSDLNGDWQRLTGYITNGNVTYPDSDLVDVRSLAFGPDSTIYIGGYLGGFLYSHDEFNFAPSNRGLMHRNGTLNQLDLFADQFENHTPNDSTKGAYELMQDWWGQLPDSNSALDIDGDPRITTLFLDIDDQYYLDTGHRNYFSGYFDYRNEFSLLAFLESNQREMFYLDTDPQWINATGAAACNQMFNLINFNQDFQESQWSREGMSAFSQWVAGYPLAAATDPIVFPTLNNLTLWGDINTVDQWQQTEQLYSFLLVLYLYEQYFPDDSTYGDQVIHTIAQLAASPYQDVAGLGRLLYEKTVGPSSDTIDYTETFGAIFNDLVMAGALDISDPSFYGGKYGFKAINSKINASSHKWYFTTSAGTEAPPFELPLYYWSARAMQISDNNYFDAQHPIKTVMLNWDDRNQIHFNLLFSLDGAFQPEMSPDSVAVINVDTDTIYAVVDTVKQKARVNLPPDLWLLGPGTPPPNFMRLLAVCTSDSGGDLSCFVLDDDTTAPPYLNLTLAQNPIDDRYLDVYSFANERIYPDGGQLYRVESQGMTALEGPRVDISGAFAAISDSDTTITLDQDLFFANDQAAAYIYHIAYHLEAINFPANLDFIAYGEDVGGNEKTSDTLGAIVDFINAQEGGYLCSAISGASLSIPPGALQRDAYVMLSVSDMPLNAAPETAFGAAAVPLDESHYAVGPLVSAGCSGLDLDSPIEVEIPYVPSLGAGQEVGVYRAEGNGWDYVGGVADAAAELIKSYSWKFGQFQALAGPLGDIQPERPYAFRLEQNYPNPFNPSTRILFELASSQHVKLQVYNLQGRRVADLADGVLAAGRHEVAWSPDRLASGIYFLRLQADEGVLYRKILYLK